MSDWGQSIELGGRDTTVELLTNSKTVKHLIAIFIILC